MLKKLFRLFKSVREYKIFAILSPLLVALEVVMEVVIPTLMANLIDDGIYSGSMDETYKIGLQLFFAALLALIFGIASGIVASKAGSGFAKNLRKDLYYKVQTFSFANIDKFSTSSLVTRLTTDVSNVQMAFQMLIRIAVRAPLMLVSSFIMVIRINFTMSLIFLAAIPVLGGLIFLIGRLAFPIFDKVFKKYDDLNNIVEENVAGIRVVKSFVLEDDEEEKFKAKSKEIHDMFVKANSIMAFQMPVMQTVTHAMMVLIAWIGAQIIVNTNQVELSTGHLTSLITYSFQISISVMMVAMLSVMSTIALASAKRIIEVLEEVPDIQNPENPIMEVENGSIEFKNVAFSYIKDKEKLALQDINLKIKSGQTIGIVGGTGDGKTSLVNLIPRLYDVTEGELIVAGHNVNEYDLEVLRDSVSCVLQKNVLFSGTIKENLRWGNKEATDEELIEACKLAQADGFITSFPNGYDTYIEQGGTNVSGGQKQRLCIARALLKKPKILILDDSTSAVDTKTDKLIREAFKDKIPNTTKIIIAQRVASVQDSDQIIVMDDGKINAIGTHEELLKSNEIYREVYESQTQEATEKGGDK